MTLKYVKSTNIEQAMVDVLQYLFRHIDDPEEKNRTSEKVLRWLGYKTTNPWGWPKQDQMAEAGKTVYEQDTIKTAVAKLLDIGLITRENESSPNKMKPYSIKESGILALKNGTVPSYIPEEPETYPENLEGLMTLAKKYAEAMFPPKGGKRGR